MLEINRVIIITQGHVLVIQTDIGLQLVRDRPDARDKLGDHNNPRACIGDTNGYWFKTCSR